MRTVAKQIEINGDKELFTQKTINGENCLVPIPPLTSKPSETIGELIQVLQTLNPDDSIFHHPSGNFPRIRRVFVPSCGIIQYLIQYW